MKYKQITLNKDLDGNLRFIEFDLPYDREDSGEYTWVGVTANIYATTDSLLWKRKLLEIQRQEAQAQIENLKRFIEKIDRLEATL